MSDDPVRWLHDPAIDEALRGALEAGRDDLPSEEQLASLEAKLGPLFGGGGPGGGGPPPAAPVKLALGKAAIAATAAVVAVGVGVIAWPNEPAPAPAPTSTSAPASAPASPPGPAPVPEGVDPPPLEPEPEPEARVAPRYETDPSAELALIERAQRSVSSAPAEALRTTREHARRFGPRASLAQERELIAIDALHRLRRDPEARARAAAFHRRWPNSAHGRRIDVLLAQ